MTRGWFMVSNKPVSRHCPNPRYTVVLGGKSLEQAPSHPAPQHVEDRVHHLAQRPFSWPPPLVRFGHERLDQSPLRIGQIRFVTQPVAACCRRVVGVHIAFPSRLHTPSESRQPRPLNPFRDGL